MFSHVFIIMWFLTEPSLTSLAPIFKMSCMYWEVEGQATFTFKCLRTVGTVKFSWDLWSETNSWSSTWCWFHHLSNTGVELKLLMLFVVLCLDWDEPLWMSALKKVWNINYNSVNYWNAYCFHKVTYQCNTESVPPPIKRLTKKKKSCIGQS